jgi:hypothetical protein
VLTEDDNSYLLMAGLESLYELGFLVPCSIHDGSWFHESAKLWLFLPVGCTLLLLWLTGIYLFFLPIFVRRRQKANMAMRGKTLNTAKDAAGSIN